jgi:ABC-2 type transport system ATP-binding protein
LEIVERLCTHVGIINNGRLVAQGPLDDLRVSIADEGTSGERMSLEEFFLKTVGGPRTAAQELSWLG